MQVFISVSSMYPLSDSKTKANQTVFFLKPPIFLLTPINYNFFVVLQCSLHCRLQLSGLSWLLTLLRTWQRGRYRRCLASVFLIILKEGLEFSCMLLIQSNYFKQVHGSHPAERVKVMNMAFKTVCLFPWGKIPWKKKKEKESQTLHMQWR